MAFEQIGLEAILEGVGDFIRDGEALNDTVAGMGSAFDAGASLIEGAGDLIAGALSGLASAALDLASSAGSALIDFFGDSFSGALEAEQTIARLGQVIESTGGIAGVTIGEAEALADQFKGLAGGSDDAVLSIIDMGLRMGTISEEEMPNFIQTTLDLAAVTGDAGKAAQLMARAQEDPLSVLGALRKEGILVTEATQAQMQAMIKTGDTAGAYALLMGTVEAATAGAAETMALTTAGQWAVFQETIADAGETIMGAFLPAINAIATEGLAVVLPIVETFAISIGNIITLLTTGDFSGGIFGLAEDDPIIDFLFQVREGFVSIQDFVITNLPLLQETFETVWASVQGVLQVLSDFVTLTLMPALATIWEQTGIQLPTAQQTFESVMNGIVIATQMVSDFITNVLVPVMTAAVDWVVTNWPAIQATAEAVWSQVQAAINTAVVFIQGLLDAFLPQITTNISTTLSGLTAFWDEHGAAIMATVETSFNTMASVISITLGLIGATVSTSLTLLSGLFATTMQLVNGDWSGAWTTIQTTITTILDGILSLVGQDLEEFTSIWTTNWEMANTLVELAWTNIQNAVTSAGTDLVNAVIGIMGSVGAAIYNSLGTFTELGTAIITYVTAGVSSAASSLAQTAADAAYAAYQAMLNALGIHSPSPMLIAVGEDFDRNIASGIESYAYIVMNEATQVGWQAVECVNDALVAGIPVIEDTAGAVGDAIIRGIDFDNVCQELGESAYHVANVCISESLAAGASDADWDSVMPPTSSGGGSSSAGGSVHWDTGGNGSVSVQPVSTGGISSGGNMSQTSNTYQYAPTYGSAPVSPQRDFALMEVLSA